MDAKLKAYYEEIKKRGLTQAQETTIQKELALAGSDDSHEGASGVGAKDTPPAPHPSIYTFADSILLQEMAPTPTYQTCLQSIDKLLERDKIREEDGFPRKIRVGRLIKPGKGGKDKVIVVPSTVEEKFIHDKIPDPEDEAEGQGGTGEGQEGEVIGEQPVQEQQGSGSGPGEGEGTPHEMESSAYDLGRILTEQFELPNLKDKGKKRSLTRYTYDLTDKNRGFGQVLDKKATLKKIIETNISLGNVDGDGPIDPTDFLISPSDKIYRILSKEKDFESQAMVFFLRDYSGSMSGKPTELVVSQHVLIYSWLLYQYDKQVETRFILHDTEAKEVPDFYTYYNSRVAGGTRVASSYRLVNEIIETESLVQDYNIYIFHGTDGDDWDTGGKESVPELKKILSYVNRMGVTIAQHGYGSSNTSEVEKYLTASGLLKEKPDLIRMDVIKNDADEQRLIDGIRKLIG